MTNSISSVGQTVVKDLEASVNSAVKKVKTARKSAKKVEPNAEGAQAKIASMIKTFSDVVKTFLDSLSKIMEKFSELTGINARPATKEPVASLTAGAAAAATNSASSANSPFIAPATTTPGVATPPAPSPSTATPATTTIPAATTKHAETSLPISAGYNDDNLSVGTSSKGMPEVFTADGYILKCEGLSEAWTLTSPEGKTTRVWGDPHVVESDGDTWDFKDRSSFLFGKNKITIETVPAGNGETLTSKVTIYSGDSRVTIGGIDYNAPKFESISRDREVDDALRDDGDVFILGKEDNGEERFILAKDTGTKFDSKFAQLVAAGENSALAKYLTREQLGFNP